MFFDIVGRGRAWQREVVPDAYNNRGRLSELTIGSTVTADYTYDGLERLAIRTTQNMTPAGTTHYLYDLSGHLLVEAGDTGQTLREYIWLDDMPLAVVSDVNTGSPNHRAASMCAAASRPPAACALIGSPKAKPCAYSQPR